MKLLNLSILFVLVSLGCGSKGKPEFTNWFKQKNLNNSASNKIYTKVFTSKSLHIDTIYRSMQGPYEIKEISIEETKEDIIWITGYKSKLIHSKNHSNVESRFMCHNNLNYKDTTSIPWKIKTSGGNSRIFTLSEGQTKLQLPEGFGIPVPSFQNFEMVSQVLNHLDSTIQLDINHEVTLSYVKESERSKPIVPLYQQSVFVTKQISGPKGSYGLPKLCVAHHLDSNSLDGEHPKHDCSTQFNSTKYNPYEDSEGRKYTGHWKIPFGEESLKTDVTPMLDLAENTSIHFIGVHLHPFASALELWDTSLDSLLYAVEIKANSVFGFDEISYYSSAKGIPVYATHKYELRNTYINSDSLADQTAMAVMYLYLEDK